MLKTAGVFLLLFALLAGPSAHAGAVHEVEARNNVFVPDVVHAANGDILRWRVTQGSHNVETYAGDATFASPMMTQASTPYEQPYAGGVILYRCRPHSTVTSGGTCVGMCGAVTDTSAPPVTPAISQPAPGSSSGATVTFAGTGQRWSTVRLTEQGGKVADALVNGAGSWQVSVQSSQGPHTVTARAYNVDGVASPGSSSVSFTVGTASSDTTRPTVQIITDGVTAEFGAARIEGIASDNVAVAQVSLHAVDLAGRPSGQVLASCPDCPAGTTSWTAVLPLSPGVYRLYAVARDTATPANASNPSSSVYTLVL